MSATTVREKRQTTLPLDVFQAAGLKLYDQVDWRFEDGEIRGRRLVPEPKPKPVVGKLVRKGSALVMDIPKGCKVEPEDIARAVREERDSQ
jgi:hypothetical protein